MFKVIQKSIFLFIIFLSTATYATTLEDSKIKNALSKKFSQTYPSLTISDIKIRPLGSIPRGFTNYKIKAIYISKASLKRSNGTFSVLYKNEKKEKKRFFKYFLNATIAVYKSTQSIKKDSQIDENDASYEEMAFTSMPFEPINQNHFYGYSAKRNIRENKILTKRDIKRIPDIKRGEIIDATLYSDGIFVNFNATAMKDANIGDIIRVKNKANKNFQARVISSSSVDIVE